MNLPREPLPLLEAPRLVLRGDELFLRGPQALGDVPVPPRASPCSAEYAAATPTANSVPTAGPTTEAVVISPGSNTASPHNEIGPTNRVCRGDR